MATEPQRRIDDEAGSDHEQGIAIGGSRLSVIGCDTVPRRAVFYDDVLAERRPHALRQNSRGDIERPARRKRHHDTHGCSESPAPAQNRRTHTSPWSLPLSARDDCSSIVSSAHVIPGDYCKRHYFGANGPTSGLPCVLCSSPSSALAPRMICAISLWAWKQVKSGRSFHANGPQSFLPALMAASCTMLIARS